MKKLGNIMANKLTATIDNVDKNAKYDKILEFCSKIKLKYKLLVNQLNA